MRENPWPQRKASFQIERQAHWLAARFGLCLHVLLALDSQAESHSKSRTDVPFSAADFYKRTRRELPENEARELSLLEVFPKPPASPYSGKDFLQALTYEDREPAQWASAFQRSLLHFEGLLLECLETRFSWERLAGPVRAHAHAFGTTRMPGTLLNQPTELPALLTHFDSPVASPSGSPLFLWERLTEKDVRYTDRSVQSPRLRKLRNLWLDSFNRAVFPGCELEQIEESDRTRFRVQIQKQIAISQLSGFKERSVTSPETPPR